MISTPVSVAAPTFESVRRRGFTLIEIMIASMILTLGLVGILALFPAAIRTGGHVVEDSNAVIIAQSVAEAIRDGIRNRKRSTKGDVNTYFIFRHDGVTDEIPADSSRESHRHDYYILLPDFKSRRETFSAPSERDQRLRAFESGKTFVYPETDSPPNGGGKNSLADNDADDGEETIGGRKFPSIRVEKTYTLGNVLTLKGAPSDRILDDQMNESMLQYSYAFAISLSYFDADLSSEPRTFRPAKILYHVRVMVYRGFVPPLPGADAWQPPAPIYELDFEVAL